MRFRRHQKESGFPYMHKKLYIKPLRKWVNYLWKPSH